MRVIAGRYRLEERLGRGGMGVVWRATDQLLGRGVAVKELPYDETLSAAEARRQRDRTLREARAVAQLSHPHIIVVHDVVEYEERPYIVMELIEGGSLADRLAGSGPVDAAEAARIGIALLGALRAAHASGVLHRDLKPDNVLLETGTDRVVLTDFGIAQVQGAPTLTENGSFVGSPEYTAPERMSGARTGPESDLWSLGALLCAALSGESPFHRDSLGGILHAVVVGDIQPPAQAGPLMPVVRGLLERDPDRRLDADRAERMLRAFRDTGRTPQPPPGYAPAERDAPRGRPFAPPQDSADRQPPGPAADVPVPGGSREEPFLRQPTRRVLVAALLVAAMAGAGVSAAALLRGEGDGDGGPVPTSSAPGTPTTRSATPSTPGRG
ncbi:protein kinase [Streptomyces olindensis]|uniref:serine/threonine-protein kinase n=1 Tax=Streptomyces olindensis TaxID=358823 RepID=UPI0036A236A1